MIEKQRNFIRVLLIFSVLGNVIGTIFIDIRNTGGLLYFNLLVGVIAFQVYKNYKSGIGFWICTIFEIILSILMILIFF